MTRDKMSIENHSLFRWESLNCIRDYGGKNLVNKLLSLELQLREKNTDIQTLIGYKISGDNEEKEDTKNETT